MGKKVKLFFPVDVRNLEEAREVMREVHPYIDVFKMGLELGLNIGWASAVNVSKVFGKWSFADTKLYDIPETIKRAAKAITGHGVAYFNVMAEGAVSMIMAAMEGADEMARYLGIERPRVIAVTVLTSQTWKDLVEKKIIPKDYPKPKNKDEQQAMVTEAVMALADMAVRGGVDCLLSSPKELAAMRAKYPDKELLSPGIRLPNSPPDDQKRTKTPYEAVMLGADGLIVGRPIRDFPGFPNREEAAKAIRAEINRALAELEK